MRGGGGWEGFFLVGEGGGVVGGIGRVGGWVVRIRGWGGVASVVAAVGWDGDFAGLEECEGVRMGILDE